ncbi:tetratricopeptide repeat-containing diguanylate cyclase [Thalassiella azotivora]
MGATSTIGTALDVDLLEDSVRRDLGAAHATAVAWLAEQGEHVDPVTLRRVLLVRVDVEARRGRTETSARVMREVNAWATEHGSTYLQARSHRLLSALFRRIGDWGTALEHAVPAVALLDAGVRAVLRADHLLGLADALGSCESFDEAHRRYQEAGRLAEQAGDQHLRCIVLNNLAYTYYQAGRGAEAVETAERLKAVTAARGMTLDVHDRDTVARAYLMDGRLDEAEAQLEPVLRGGVEGESDFDGVAQCLLTLAEIQRRGGRTQQAQATLDRCRALAEEQQLSGVALEVLEEQSALHAAAGRYQEAYETFRAFHAQERAVKSAEKEAQARTRQAIFETTEARRDSERFRRLAERDPLTGLHNRRYVDAQLTTLLVEAADTGRPLTVALVDLDHFKSVNDTYSHEVGDVVLRRVAGVLLAAAGEVDGGVAARMGGEEFLLVLPGLSGPEAAQRLEAVRRDLAAHPWADVLPDRVVTASIGAASAPQDAVDRSQLLRAADDRLYQAKAAGRDRVVVPSPRTG